MNNNKVAFQRLGLPGGEEDYSQAGFSATYRGRPLAQFAGFHFKAGKKADSDQIQRKKIAYISQENDCNN